MSLKYHKDAPFQDPVLRCDSCQKLMLNTIMHALGKCPNCGNRKVRNVTTMNNDEYDWMKEKNIDPEFLALFESMPEVEI